MECDLPPHPLWGPTGHPSGCGVLRGLPLQFEVGVTRHPCLPRGAEGRLGGLKGKPFAAASFTGAVINTAGVAWVCALTALLQEGGLGPRPRSEGLQRGGKGVSVSVELNILTVNSNL